MHEGEQATKPSLTTKRRGEVAEAAFLHKAASLGFSVAKPWATAIATISSSTSPVASRAFKSRPRPAWAPAHTAFTRADATPARIYTAKEIDNQGNCCSVDNKSACHVRREKALDFSG